MSMRTRSIPILLSVYARTFKSITDEMSISMEQTTRSPILCEAKDYVTGLYDADGNMLEQTENLPILAFSLAPVCKYIKRVLRRRDLSRRRDLPQRRLQPGQPEQRRRRLQAGVPRRTSWSRWTAVKGHQADIGGNVRRRLQPERGRGLAGGAAHSAGQGGRARQAAQGRLEPDLRQRPAGHRAARHEGRDGRLHRRRAAPARAAEQVRRRELRGAQAGAVRRHAQDDGSRDRQDPERQLLGRGLRLLRRPPRRLEVHHPRRHRGQGRVDIKLRLLAHRRRRPTASSTAPSPRAPRPPSSPCCRWSTPTSRTTRAWCSRSRS